MPNCRHTMKPPQLTAPLRNALTQLTKEFRPVVYSKVPPGADPVGTVPALGIGLRFTPRLKPLLAVRDWLEAQVRQTDGSLQPFLDNDAAVVIHWPTFLRRAWAPGGEDVYATQARRIWKLCAPYVRDADPVLASYLTATPDNFDAVQQHAELMLDSAQGRRICRALVEATTPIRDVAAHKKFSRCSSCLKEIAEAEKLGQVVTPESCRDCSARGKLAAFCSVIGLEHTFSDSAGLKFVYSLGKVLPRNSVTLPVAPAVHDIAWLLAGRSDYDGAWREGSLVGVNWDTYAARLRENKLRDPDAKDRVLRVAERFHAVNPDGKFHASKLKAALEELLSPGMHAKRRALADAPSNAFGPRMRQAVAAMYETNNGTVEASIRRHGSRWCVRIPLQLTPGVKLPRHVRLQRRDAEQDFGEYWWYARDLQAYAVSLRQAYCAVEAVSVESLLTWFTARVSLYRAQPKLFKDAMFDAKAATRVAEVFRGERQRLGRFSPAELNTLDTFLYERGLADCGRPFRGPFTDDEWQRLSELLPCRSRAMVNAKVHALGFDYAKAWGYVNYLKSGYGISKSSRRRAAWLMKGVPLTKETP